VTSVTLLAGNTVTGVTLRHLNAKPRFGSRDSGSGDDSGCPAATVNSVFTQRHLDPRIFNFGAKRRLPSLRTLGIVFRRGRDSYRGNADGVVRHGLASNKPLLARVGSERLRLFDHDDRVIWMNLD
jgi:hypothetical protein